MKTLPIISLFLLLNSSLYSQNNYVLVAATDTILCPVDIVHYQIDVEQGLSDKMVSSYLDRKNTGYRRIDHPEYNNFQRYELELNSWDAILEFTDPIDKNSLTIRGEIIEAKPKLSAIDLKRLYEKIIIKTKDEAVIIASAIGKDVLEIAEVKYKENQFSRGTWNAYPPINRTVGISFETKESNDGKIIVQRSLQVKFKVE